MDAEELFEKFSPMVYNLALRLSGNKSDAQDIAQDAFLKAVRGLANLREESFAGTWLYRITVNVWKNRVRSEKRRSFWKTFSLSWGDDGGEKPALQVQAPDAPLDAAIDKRDEKTYAEIAEITEKPLGTVKSSISRAREALRLKMSAVIDHGS